MDILLPQRRGIALPDFAPFADGVEEPVPDILSPLLGAAFDQLAMGIAILTVDGELLHGNKAARDALRDCGIAIDAALRLIASRPSDAMALEQALDAAAGLRRTLLSLGPTEHAIDVAVQPLLTGALSRRATRAMLIFSRRSLCDGATLMAYVRAHRLTRTESAVLSALATGLRVKEVAQQMQSSIATVRSHLRSIYGKTGARDLHDLLARIAVLPSLGPSVL